jgi:hypothetical protein
MTTKPTVAPRVENVEDLERAGFSPEQIKRLVAAREAYSPLIELVESGQELRRLQFLRWLYQHGAYQAR